MTKKTFRYARMVVSGLMIALTFLVAGATFAQDGVDFSTAEIAFAIDNFVMFICAVLVLFMQAGFAMVEAGLNGGKNTINVLFLSLIHI